MCLQILVFQFLENAIRGERRAKASLKSPCFIIIPGKQRDKQTGRLAGWQADRQVKNTLPLSARLPEHYNTV